MEIPKRYKPQEEEKDIREFWEKEDIYAFNPEGKQVFSIDTPPPTLSGKMHLGHAFSYAQGDFIARYRRMRGDAVFYPFGTDDNGLPTERLIEKQQGIKATRMDRSEFRKVVLKAVEEQLPEFSFGWQRLGISCDFKGAYSTINDHSRKISQLSFLRLVKDNKAYRKESPVVWCMQCQTAIAQAEFDNVDKNSVMNTMAFSDEQGNALEIMTTRPELIPACVAVACHPEDDRFTHLHGKKAVVPITGHSVPIIQDESVAMDKGTGLMMVCTFGDKEDVEKWHKHNLDLRIIFTKDGKVSDDVEQFAGMRIEDARKAIIAALEEQGLLIKQESITHATNVHERCGTPIEFLKTPQWNINVLDHKDELLKAGKEIDWYPKFMRTRYEHWVENLGWDWTVSRQRPYGVPIPVWYEKATGEVVLPEEDELPIDPTETVPRAWKGREDELEPEKDVLDTWATSSCTPQIALDWTSDDFAERFPMSVRLQAHDIIRTWAFYTITKAYYHHETIPWNDIIISGHALDPKGKKMSKSKGNVIDPFDIWDKYSADAMRYWAATTKLGEDLPFQEKDVVTGHKTVNKIWNASKFTMMQLEGYDGSRPEKLEPMDEWLLAHFAEAVTVATENLDQYEYSKAKTAVDSFFWNTFCDYYLEIIKDRFYNEERSEDSRQSARYTLYTVLLGQLKLYAPIMPHITERVYQLFFKEKEGAKSIHVSDWPSVDSSWVNDSSQKAGDLVADLIGRVRKYKSDNQMSLGADLENATISVSPEEKVMIEDALVDFKATAKIASVEFTSGDLDIRFE